MVAVLAGRERIFPVKDKTYKKPCGNEKPKTWHEQSGDTKDKRSPETVVNKLIVLSNGDDSC